MYNILGYLVFAVADELPIIAYQSPPSGGVNPPGPPQGRGGRPPPTTTPNKGVGLRPSPQPPPAMRAYQACELLAKTHGVGFVDGTCLWGRCGGNATMGYIKNDASRMGYTLRTEVSLKKNEHLAKVTL